MSIYRGRNRKEFYLASLLYDSIEDRDLSSVKSLLAEKRADPNLVLPKKGISPFHLAIGCDCNDFAITITTLILQNGGNPNVRSDDGLTPLHIAAAWGRLEILRLLLSCGGDPESKDINYKTPLHYALEENFTECLNLLKSHLPNKNEVLNRENEDCNKYDLILDKVVIDNGVQIGEYEVVKHYQESSITKNDLQLLPQPDTTEYVMSWFDKHHQTYDQPSLYSVTRNNNCSNSDSIDSFESSVDESDVEIKKIQAENITFRKVYKKTRKISKDSSGSRKSVTSKLEDKSLYSDAKELHKIDDKTMYTSAQDFTANKEFSQESGIITLPSSTKGNSLFFEELNQSPEKCISLIKPDASSDYMTCSTNSDAQFLEKNIFEITDDVSVNILTADETTSDKSTEIVKNSERVESPELSFVSISEVYKYVDEDEGVVLFERRFLKTPTNGYCGSVQSSSFSSKLSSLPDTVDYDTDTLRRELTLHGFNPGPITFTTKRIYLKKLKQLKKKPIILRTNDVTTKKAYSIEVEKTLRDTSWQNDLTAYKALEEALAKQFSSPDPSRKWREGVNKSSFTYLLLDPRITNNLPCRAETMQPKEIWETFLSAIFYVGKGKRARPYSHLYDAISLWKKKEYKTSNKKLQHIIDIWQNNTGVICLHIFQNIIPVEAYTREASMISALKIENVRNLKAGDFYGVAATWNQKQKRMLGVYLLYKAMMIFLNEGERQLCPNDID